MSNVAGKSRKEIRQAKRQRQGRLWQLALGAAGVAILAVIGYFIWDAVRPKPGESVPLQGRAHIQVSDPHEPYNSDPPTSGAHAAPVNEGFYSEPLPDENLVHNLEHGYVIIWYNCERLTDGDCDTLEAQIRDVIDRNGKKLIAVPRPTLDVPIAITSWGRLDKLDQFDETEIVTFIKEFRNKAPEPGAP